MMFEERITWSGQLRVGDVVVVVVTLRDDRTGADRLWKRFACVTATSVAPSSKRVEVLTLKLHPSDRDLRVLRLDGDDKVYKLPEELWPAGVVAMRMKYIHTGRVKLEDM